MPSRAESLALDLARELIEELKGIAKKGRVVVAIDSEFNEFLGIEEAPSDEDAERIDRIAELLLSIAYCFDGIREEVYRMLREAIEVRDYATEENRILLLQ